ncbi:MAG: TolB family protein [Acidimicrobiales bacterium]
MTVLGVAVASLVVVDGRLGPAEKAVAPAAEREETTTTRRRARSRPPRTTVPVTTTVPSIPPMSLGEPTGLRLLGMGDGGSYLIDLDSGAVAFLPSQRQSYNYNYPVSVGGGFVVADGRARFVADLISEDPGVVLGPANRAVASNVPNRVWLLDEARVDASSAREVDLTTAAVTDEVSLPVAVWVVDAVEGGLLVSGPDGAYVWDRELGWRRVAHGRPLAGAGDQIVTHECDETLRCYLALHELDGGDGRELPDSGPQEGAAAFSPDGRYLATVEHDETVGAGLVDVHDLVRGEVVHYPGSVGTTSGTVHWSPDSRWLVWMATGSTAIAYDVTQRTVNQVPVGTLPVAFHDIEVLGPAG